MLKRVIPALAVSASVTFGLFYLMQALVAYDEVKLEEEKTFRFVDNVQDIQETPPQAKTREIEKPPEVEDMPEVEIEDIDQDIGPSDTGLSLGPARTSANVELGQIDLGAAQDGDYLPLVRVQPQYPRRAQQRGIEGYIIVSLTVNEDGTVSPDSIQIIEEDPKGYFGRAAVKAAAKFKYKPKIVNGKGQKVSGVTYKFSFNLAN